MRLAYTIQKSEKNYTLASRLSSSYTASLCSHALFHSTRQVFFGFGLFWC
ncbi:unnamed protein product [Chondrus crispus]|uniref:Uncharacterized protein n=1 Tax=Chondrus crispus TaxID=2769 RepID=R7QBB3_CHOCR|nr:unnamed protein product [Chondrus crispus]CDF34711.1 unnamed protein product [Chondrus crispus]|eukprot:XP_005714530.1 unnamed protein product [Chondrus crispus]